MKRPGPDLPPPVVRVGCIDTASRPAAEAAADAALLDDEERAACDRFVFDTDRRDYAAAHALLRRMLSEALPDVAAEAWRFVRTPQGRPLLAPPAPPIGFNLSHTRGIVACAVAETPEVGIDAECASRRMEVEPLAREVCSAQERAQLRAVPPEMRAGLFLDLWTLKEAYLKALGIGITSRPLSLVSFDLGRPGAILTELASERPPWRFVLLRPTAMCRVSLAVRSAAHPTIEARMRGSGAFAPLLPALLSPD